MIAKCVCNEYTGPALVLPTQVDGVTSTFDLVIVGGWFSIYGERVGYNITIGKKYDVYGVMQYDGHIYYLIQDEWALCCFAPHSLFEIYKLDIPFGWKINCFNIEHGPLLIIGYDGITDSYDKLIQLINRDRDMVREFLDYKDWLNVWYND